MPNNIFRARTIAQIEAALVEYDLSGELGHQGVKGLLREIVVRNLLAPILPPLVEIGTGIIVDAHGKQSSQTASLKLSSTERCFPSNDPY